jgi:hypothetical protein
MGAGRSGTSMLSGILHQAGYFMGDKLYLPKESNPKGFFEWKEINGINEEILSNFGKSLYSTILKRVFKRYTVKAPGKNQRWLLELPVKVIVNNADPKIEEKIREVGKHEPFCYKDPRFSYTLPVWRQLLPPGTVYICIFREPNVTVESILKECCSRDYLANLSINRKDAYRVWAAIHSHILSHYIGFQSIDKNPHFFFVHYNQIYDGSALPSLARFLDAPLSDDFVEKELKRTVANGPIPPKAETIYLRLCELAGYTSVR